MKQIIIAFPKGKLRFRDVDGSFIPSEVYQDTLCVGSCNGDYNLNEFDIENSERLIIVIKKSQP